MSLLSKLPVIFLSVLLSLSCVLSHADISVARTAITAGKDKWRIDFMLNLYEGWDVDFSQKQSAFGNSESGSIKSVFSFGPFAPRFLVSRGLSENLDLTLRVSVPPSGYNNLSLKYAFLNNSSGVSTAGVLMLGLNDRLYSQYLGFILSYKNNWLEPYFNIGYFIRFLDTKNTNIWDIDYIISNLGINFWATKSFAVNLSASFIFVSNWLFDNESYNDAELSAWFELAVPKIGITYRF